MTTIPPVTQDGAQLTKPGGYSPTRLDCTCHAVNLAITMDGI
jgi:hypothetical protein